MDWNSCRKRKWNSRMGYIPWKNDSGMSPSWIEGLALVFFPLHVWRKHQLHRFPTVMLSILFKMMSPENKSPEKQLLLVTIQFNSIPVYLYSAFKFQSSSSPGVHWHGWTFGRIEGTTWSERESERDGAMRLNCPSYQCPQTPLLLSRTEMKQQSLLQKCIFLFHSW